MLARSHRFHGYSSLNWAYRHCETVRDQKLSLKYANNPKRSSFRVAVVISRKVNKSAAVRNRIRRRVYEILRSHEKQIGDNFDLIFSVYNDDLADMESDELKGLVDNLLKRAKIL